MIGFVSSRKGGKAISRTFNRELYPEQAIAQCLSAREVNFIKLVFDGKEKASDDLLNAITEHIEGCCACRDKIANVVGFAHKPLMAIGIAHDSLHTSVPPERACEAFCHTHQKISVKDIDDWSKIRVH